MRQILGLGITLCLIGCSVHTEPSKRTATTASTGASPEPTCGPIDEVAFDPGTPALANGKPGAHCERDIDCAAGNFCIVTNEACADPSKLEGPGLGGHLADGTSCVAAPAFQAACDSTALTWNQPIGASTNPSSLAESDTAIVTDGHGKVVIGWANNKSGAREQFNGLALSTDDGDSFTSIGAPNNLPTDAENDAALAIDGNGLIYYVWEGYANDFQGAQHVFSSQSQDGMTWSPALQVDTMGDDDNGQTALDFPSVAINPVNQRPYFTYQITKTTSAPPLKLVVGAAGGASVSPSVDLNDGKRTGAYRDLANGVFDSSGSYYTAWTELVAGSSGMGLESGATSSAVYFTRVDLGAADALVPLGHDVLVSGKGEPILFGIPQIVTTSDGMSQYVIYETGTKNAIDVRVATSHDRGKTWAQSIIVNDDASCATHYDASGAVDAQGRLWVLWYDNRDGQGHVVYSMSDDGGQTFHTNRLVTPNAFPFETFQYSVGWLGDYFGVTTSNGNIYAAWADPHEADQSHIYFSKAALPQ